jgi:hypothetical protein
VKNASQTKAENGCTINRRTAAFELALLLAILEWVVWTDNKRVLDRPARLGGYIVLGMAVVALVCRQPVTRARLGLSTIGSQNGLAPLAALTVVAMVALTLIGWTVGTIGQTERLWEWVANNWIVDGGQQVLLQVVLVPRLAVILASNGPRVSIVSAGVFSLLHAPNLPLMGMTFFAGAAWCEWFRRYRNLPAVWLSHVVLAATTLYCLDGPALRRMRVGISYLLHSLNYS